MKLETKLFPRLPKFQPCATHHPPSPALSSPTSRSHNNPRRSPVANLSLDCPSAVPHPAPGSIQRPPQTHPTCPSSSPRRLTHLQQSVHTPGSIAAPPSSCLQLIKSCRLNTPTHHLYQLQIQPCLQLVKPQQLLASQPTCTYNPFTATSLPSFGRMGNSPPAAHAGPTHRLDEIQAREQHTLAKLSENSDGESSAGGTELVTSFTN